MVRFGMNKGWRRTGKDSTKRSGRSACSTRNASGSERLPVCPCGLGGDGWRLRRRHRPQRVADRDQQGPAAQGHLWWWCEPVRAVSRVHARGDGGLRSTPQPTYSFSVGTAKGLRPAYRAQACGTPAIVTDFSAQSELVPDECGWRVVHQPEWDPAHQARYGQPLIVDIVDRLVDAYKADRETMAGDT